MKVCLFELKAQGKGAVLWAASLVGVLLAFLLGTYPLFQEDTQDILRMLSGFPPQFAAAFGMDVSSLFSLGGFYGFAFSYIGLIGAIMAAAGAPASFSREKRAKCTDFLLTKPIGRRKIFAAKLAAGAAILLAANALYAACCIPILRHGGVPGDKAALACLSLLLTQAVFYAMAVLFATCSRRVRSVSGTAIGFGFAGFILSALVGILKEDAVRFAAPLKYFDPADVFASGGYDAPYAATGAAIILVCLLLSAVLFCRKDARAV